MSNRELHSVVVPVFNEEEGIEQFHARCSAAMREMGEDYEIVYVDDGSKDTSWDKLVTIAESDNAVRLVRFSRNFGHQIAISAGMEYATGDTVTVIDADLQDPPELIAEMIEKWRDGADIVYAIRTMREGETVFKKLSASAFYRMLRALADVDIPLDAGDFRLMSRRTVEALISMPEHHRFVRGMVAWIGYETDSVTFTREPRFAGETKYPLKKMIVFAADGIMAFSLRPLRIATWLGILTSTGAFVAVILLVILRLTGAIAVVQGWTSLAILVLLTAGVQLVTMGILGEYIGRIYTEVRARPLYLVRDVRGFAGGPHDEDR